MPGGGNYSTPRLCSEKEAPSTFVKSVKYIKNAVYVRLHNHCTIDTTEVYNLP